MTLNFEQFKLFAEEFLSLSSSVGDKWILKSANSNEMNIYLEKRCTLPSLKHSGSSDSNDINTIVQNPFYVFVYHVVYSHSYSVPVLYFNAYHPSGRLLTLDEIWDEIPDCYQNNLDNIKWNMITQQEHPLLGIPYFMVHPCYTADFMSTCPSSNYVITWLSIVGPLVGIHLSLEYSKYVQPCKKVV